jgi:hypothetical protein
MFLDDAIAASSAGSQSRPKPSSSPASRLRLLLLCTLTTSCEFCSDFSLPKGRRRRLIGTYEVVEVLIPINRSSLPMTVFFFWAKFRTVPTGKMGKKRSSANPTKGFLFWKNARNALYFKDFEEKTKVQSRHNLDNQPLDIA